jgi:hypothetical protein
MASPLTITTTPAVVISFNKKRKTISFQNTGANVIYLKKQIPGAAVSIPSATNYDLELFIAGTDPDVITFTTSAAWMAVAGAATSTLAVLETVKVH